MGVSTDLTYLVIIFLIIVLFVLYTYKTSDSMEGGWSVINPAFKRPSVYPVYDIPSVPAEPTIKKYIEGFGTEMIPGSSQNLSMLPTSIPGTYNPNNKSGNYPYLGWPAPSYHAREMTRKFRESTNRMALSNAGLLPVANNATQLWDSGTIVPIA